MEERRRDIIAATVPLLEEEGFAVSTKKIAGAAGVAEGTIFRVFPTKEELLRAAITSYMDPADLIARLDAVDRGLPLDAKMSEVMSILQESAFRARTFMMTMRGISVEAMTRARADAGFTEFGRRVRPGATFRHGFGPRYGQDAVGSPSAGDGSCPAMAMAAVAGHRVGASGDGGRAGTLSDRDESLLGGHQHPHAAQARALSNAIERLLANNQSQLAVDLPTAAAYIFTTGMASLFLTASLSALSVSTYVALTVRALTIEGAAIGDGTSGDESATVPSATPAPHRKEQE